MNAFLSVAQGSVEVPWLLELRLNMAEGDPPEVAEGQNPIALVGKGEDYQAHTASWLSRLLRLCICIHKYKLLVSKSCNAVLALGL